ncbi:MAG: amidase [Bacteroidota bacterium]
MQTQGRFKLMTVTEFGQWLEENTFSRVIKLVQNHHTYIPNYSHFKGNNQFASLEAMERFHIERGFSEIAQNLTIFPDGSVAVCRSFDKIPAGIKGANQYGICIENVGCFDIGGDTMTAAQRDAIIKVNAMLCRKFKLTPSPDTIVYHHWYDLVSGMRTGGTGTTKSCPGTAFFGGNTINDALHNFLPLIVNELKNSGTVIPVASQPQKTYEVTAYVLNVRSGPGVSNGIVKSLQKGTHVIAYEEKNGWCRIDAAQQQWVSKSYLLEV